MSYPPLSPFAPPPPAAITATAATAVGHGRHLGGLSCRRWRFILCRKLERPPGLLPLTSRPQRCCSCGARCALAGSWPSWGCSGKTCCRPTSSTTAAAAGPPVLHDLELLLAVGVLGVRAGVERRRPSWLGRAPPAWLRTVVHCLFEVAPASWLVTIVLWGILLPADLMKYHVCHECNFFSYNQHAVNTVVLLVEFGLNDLVVTWHHVGLAVIWSVTYCVFSWVSTPPPTPASGRTSSCSSTRRWRSLVSALLLLGIGLYAAAVGASHLKRRASPAAARWQRVGKRARARRWLSEPMVDASRPASSSPSPAAPSLN